MFTLNQPAIQNKYHLLGVQKRHFQISYDLTSTTDFPSSQKKEPKTSTPNSTKDFTCDQANEISIFDTNTDICQ